MAEIFSFRAYRYNAARVEPAKVLTQPYDKITPAMADKYAAASPYNLIPVEKGKALPEDAPGNTVYTRAAKALEDWVRAGVIVRDATPSLYAYFQEYTVPGTSDRRVRKGFIALGRVEDYSAGVVFRHEQTLSGPKADRLELLRHTKTHTGQLFMLYSDAAARVDMLLDALRRGEIHHPLQIVLRLHPDDRVGRYLKYRHAPEVVMDIPERFFATLGWTMNSADLTRMVALLHHADLMVNFATTVNKYRGALLDATSEQIERTLNPPHGEPRADAYLTKPLNVDEFLTVIDRFSAKP